MNRVISYIVLFALIVTAYFVLVEIPSQLRFAPRTALETSPADLGMVYENFQISPADADITLHGWWMPATRPLATLLFLHGGSSNRDSRFFEGLEFYQAMVEQGVSVAAIDLRNHGDSDSDGQGIQFGRTEHYDAQALVDWAKQQQLTQPVVLMGISMGGATAIRAIHEGADVDGLILLDSLLNTQDAIKRAIWTQSGLPHTLMVPSAWAAVRFYGFPDGHEQPLELATNLDLPILVIQDPQDPVTRAIYSKSLTARNPQAKLWLAPEAPADHPELSSRGRWGSHVAAFVLHPQETVAKIMGFVQTLAAK